MRRTAILVAVCCLFILTTPAQRVPKSPVAPINSGSVRFGQIKILVDEAINARKLPGAVVVIGRRDRIIYREAFGRRSVEPTTEPMSAETIFDAASLTKVVATAMSIMILVEEGKLRLSDTIGMYFPDIQDFNAKRVTILQLLTHVSGYAPDFDLREKWTGREGMLDALRREKLRTAPGTKFVYSDIGFIVLGEIVSRVSGMPQDQFALERTFRPLGMNSTGFRTTLKVPASAIAPTENIRGQNSYLGATFDGDEKSGKRILRGEVHDPTAFRMGGVAGHAGLFTTADDLARFGQMILNGGVLNGQRILSPQTVARMTTPQVVSEDASTRGLGWDMNTTFSSNRGELFPLGSFGHTGFTGTSLWIDPVSQTYVVFMSNRVHPDGKGDVGALRARVATIAASAGTDVSAAQRREFETAYNAAILPQIVKFEANSSTSKLVSPNPDSNSATIKRPVVMVLNGIDVLERNGFKELQGMKIGLVTNQTGRNLDGRATIDVLKEAKGVNLVALFSPEHGIRGELDQEKINDSVDEKTGLPVFSLYGETRRPKPEQIKDLDALVYDIQDIGTRFYTYTATLLNVMEEAAKLNKPVFVLDRPNPLGGLIVEGPLADEDKLSFIAAHTIPVRYGLTIGELGLMMNTERRIGADVRVIKMENWSRSKWFDETGQTWINPSPNMRSLTQATLYPGIGLLETTNLSVGRGTDTPFEVVGAPWIDPQKLAAVLNERGLPGVRFIPVRFKPKASVFKDEECGGINIVITDRARFDSVKTGIEIAVALKSTFGDAWQVEKYGRLLVNGGVLEMLKAGRNRAEIEGSWRNLNADFDRRRTAFFLYK